MRIPTFHHTPCGEVGWKVGIRASFDFPHVLYFHVQSIQVLTYGPSAGPLRAKVIKGATNSPTNSSHPPYRLCPYRAIHSNMITNELEHRKGTLKGHKGTVYQAVPPPGSRTGYYGYVRGSSPSEH